VRSWACGYKTDCRRQCVRCKLVCVCGYEKVVVEAVAAAEMVVVAAVRW
jgi:hypothetical protein